MNRFPAGLLSAGKNTEAITSRIAETALLDKLLASDPANIEFALRRSWSDFGIAQIEYTRADYIAAMRGSHITFLFTLSRCLRDL